MPTEISLGYVAAQLVVHLTPDADFIQTLTTSDASDWPTGTQIALVFGDGTTWAATVAGSTASWSVDKAAVNTLRQANPNGTLTARVTYTDGAGVDLVWMSGRVGWHG